MRFPMSACKHWHKKEARVYGCLLGEHPFDEEMILYKNKNKNKIVQATTQISKHKLHFLKYTMMEWLRPKARTKRHTTQLIASLDQS